jgi:hypothetical protein
LQRTSFTAIGAQLLTLITIMKKALIFLIAFVCITNCYPQSEKDQLEVGESIQADINSLLLSGMISAEIMDGFIQNPRQVELMMKFQEGIQKNYEWFMEEMKTVDQGKPMSYHPNLGLSEEEYKEFLSIIKDFESTSSGKEAVEIIKNDTVIVFKANGKLKILEEVKIHLYDNTIIIGPYKLSYAGPANITSSENALKSKWKGHNWSYEFPENMNPDLLKDLENLVARHYKFTIGRLEKNGKTFMQIKGLEFNKGVKEVEFDIPLIF